MSIKSDTKELNLSVSLLLLIVLKNKIMIVCANLFLKKT